MRYFVAAIAYTRDSLDSGRPTLSMQLELRHHLNDGSASEESEMKEKAVKRYCTMNEYL